MTAQNLRNRVDLLRNFHRDQVADMPPDRAVAHLLDLVDWLMEPVDCTQAPICWPGVRLVGMEAAILRRLSLAANRPVAREQLHRLWYIIRAEDDLPCDESLSVYICRLRKKLKPTPVSITTWRALGYSLNVPAGVALPWERVAA